MRTLVGAAAATLVGCSCYVSPQAGIEACTVADGSWFACFDRTVINQTAEPDPTTFNANPSTPRLKSTVTAKTGKPSAHGRDKTRLAKAMPPATTATKVEAAASSRPAETADPVIAKSTIAANFQDPSSTELVEILVKDDEACVVDGPASSAAATAYRNIRPQSMIRKNGKRSYRENAQT
jgi:hypothetical protein